MILGVISGSSKSGRFDVSWSLKQKVAQGGPKDPFLHPRTSKLSFPGTLQGHLVTKVLQKVPRIVCVASFVCSFVRLFGCLIVCLLVCLV